MVRLNVQCKPQCLISDLSFENMNTDSFEHRYVLTITSISGNVPSMAMNDKKIEKTSE